MHFTYTTGAWEADRFGTHLWVSREVGSGSVTIDMPVYSETREDWPTRPDAPNPSYMSTAARTYVTRIRHLLGDAEEKLNFMFPPAAGDNTAEWTYPGFYCQHIRWQGVASGKFGEPGDHTFFWQKKPMRGRRCRLQPLAEGARKL